MAAEPPPEVAGRPEVELKVAARPAEAAERQVVEPLVPAGPAAPFRAVAEPSPEVAAGRAEAVELQAVEQPAEAAERQALPARPPPEELEQQGLRPSWAFGALFPFLLSPSSPWAPLQPLAACSRPTPSSRRTKPPLSRGTRDTSGPGRSP
jgi:hypothetical protein